jgi:hypothetical protein
LRAHIEQQEILAQTAAELCFQNKDGWLAATRLMLHETVTTANVYKSRVKIASPAVLILCK